MLFTQPLLDVLRGRASVRVRLGLHGELLGANLCFVVGGSDEAQRMYSRQSARDRYIDLWIRRPVDALIIARCDSIEKRIFQGRRRDTRSNAEFLGAPNDNDAEEGNIGSRAGGEGEQKDLREDGAAAP